MNKNKCALLVLLTSLLYSQAGCGPQHPCGVLQGPAWDDCVDGLDSNTGGGTGDDGDPFKTAIIEEPRDYTDVQGYCKFINPFGYPSVLAPTQGSLYDVWMGPTENFSGVGYFQGVSWADDDKQTNMSHWFSNASNYNIPSQAAWDSLARDWFFADSVSYAVYNGHGQHQRISWNKNANWLSDEQNTCILTYQDDIRLGKAPAGNDGQNWFQLTYSCCAGYVWLSLDYFEYCNETGQDIDDDGIPDCDYPWITQSDVNMFQNTIGRSDFGQWLGFVDAIQVGSAQMSGAWWITLNLTAPAEENNYSISSGHWHLLFYLNGWEGGDTKEMPIAYNTGRPVGLYSAYENAYSLYETGNMKFPHNTGFTPRWDPRGWNASFAWWYDANTKTVSDDHYYGVCDYAWNANDVDNSSWD